MFAVNGQTCVACRVFIDIIYTSFNLKVADIDIEKFWNKAVTQTQPGLVREIFRKLIKELNSFHIFRF